MFWRGSDLTLQQINLDHMGFIYREYVVKIIMMGLYTKGASLDLVDWIYIYHFLKGIIQDYSILFCIVLYYSVLFCINQNYSELF